MDDYKKQREFELELWESMFTRARLILHNDDVNTFDYVIECLVEVCGHTLKQAEQCSLIAHFKGKCQVQSGPVEKLKPIREALIDRGLNATIESDEEEE